MSVSPPSILWTYIKSKAWLPASKMEREGGSMVNVSIYCVRKILDLKCLALGGLKVLGTGKLEKMTMRYSDSKGLPIERL